MTQVYYEIVLKNVPLIFTNEHLHECLNTAIPGKVTSVWRILGYPDRYKTKCVRIRTLDKTWYDEALINGLTLNGTNFKAEKRRIKYDIPWRCYHCHCIGSHLSRECTNEIKCRRCSQNHHENYCKSEALHCCNCGQDHAANDPKCTVWIQKCEDKRLESIHATKMDTKLLQNELISQTLMYNETVAKLQDTVQQQNNKLTQIQGVITTEINKKFEEHFNPLQKQVNELISACTNTINTNTEQYTQLDQKLQKITNELTDNIQNGIETALKSSQQFITSSSTPHSTVRSQKRKLNISSPPEIENLLAYDDDDFDSASKQRLEFTDDMVGDVIQQSQSSDANVDILSATANVSIVETEKRTIYGCEYQIAPTPESYKIHSKNIPKPIFVITDAEKENLLGNEKLPPTKIIHMLDLRNYLRYLHETINLCNICAFMENVTNHMCQICSKNRLYRISPNDFYRLNDIMSFKYDIECDACKKSFAFANYICHGYIRSDGS